MLDAVEVVVVGIEGDLLAGEDPGHDRERLVERPQAIAERLADGEPVRRELLGQAAGAEAERHPPVRDVVERGRRLGDDARIAERVADSQVAELDLCVFVAHAASVV